MPYVSQLLGKPVADVDGARIGHLDDLIGTPRGDMPHPVVVAIVVKTIARQPHRAHGGRSGPGGPGYPAG